MRLVRIRILIPMTWRYTWKETFRAATRLLSRRFVYCIGTCKSATMQSPGDFTYKTGTSYNYPGWYDDIIPVMGQIRCWPQRYIMVLSTLAEFHQSATMCQLHQSESGPDIPGHSLRRTDQQQCLGRDVEKADQDPFVVAAITLLWRINVWEHIPCFFMWMTTSRQF